MASRTLLLPRKENETLDSPPETCTGRHLLLDQPCRLDEGHGVVVVFLDTGGNGEDVGIEDDVFGREADLFGEQPVAALADRHLALDGVGLALLVEGHDHHGGAVALDARCMLEKRVFAFLQRDGIDDALALDAFQPGLDHAPLGGIEHDRHAGDVRLAGDQIQEVHHGLLRVQQAFVHVDVDDLGAVLDLLARHRQRLVVVVVLDQALEPRRAGDVGALADVDEVACRA